MKGFIRLPRELMTDSIFKNPLDFRLLLLILANATFQDYEHEGIPLKKGQWIRSLRKLQEDLSYIDKGEVIRPPLSTLQYTIKRLEKKHYLTNVRTPLGTLFTLNEVLTEQVFGHNEIEDSVQDSVANVEELRTRSIKNLKYNNKSNNKDITLTSANICPSFADVYHQNYGRMLTPIQIQDFIAYMEKDGVEEELLNFAFEVAIKVSSHINYVRAIINNWIASGIRTKKGAEQEYNRKRGNTDHGKDQYSDIDFGW